MNIFKTILISILYILTLIFIYYIGTINIYLMVSLLVIFTIPFFYSFYKLFNDYHLMNDTLENIINDKIDARDITKYVNYRRFNANLNRLARKIEKMTYIKEEDKLTIEILTNNITSPIIYIDRDGRIQYVNNQFLNTFNVNLEINDIYEKLRIQKIYRFIDDAFIFETKNVQTILIKEHYYQAVAIPINNKQSNHFSFIGILFIFNDITELKRYEKLQKEFLADASHELKTPIAAIKGASEILLNGEMHSRDTISDFLSIIKSENERMERIVYDLLLISRLENDKLTLNMEEIFITDIIIEVNNILQKRIENKNQTLYLDLDKDLKINGDYERLKHVFLNLLSNAINYTDDNKSIHIKAYKVNNEVIVSIKDEGIGISEDNIPHIFKRFYRVDKARSRETGGTGLGLAIVKSTLDIHKAKIQVNSKLNEGTEFIVYFKK